MILFAAQINYMTEVEEDHPIGDSSAPVVQVDVSIPGLRPEIHGSDGKISRLSNLSNLAKQAREIFSEKPWYRPLLSDVRQGKKSAIFVTALGGITIFVAAAAGFEFGVRHGKDLKHLPRILKRR